MSQPEIARVISSTPPPSNLAPMPVTQPRRTWIGMMAGIGLMVLAVNLFVFFKVGCAPTPATSPGDPATTNADIADTLLRGEKAQEDLVENAAATTEETAPDNVPAEDDPPPAEDTTNTATERPVQTEPPAPPPAGDNLHYSVVECGFASLGAVLNGHAESGWEAVSIIHRQTDNVVVVVFAKR